MVAANADAEFIDKLRASQVRIDAVIVKPLSQATLQNKIETVLNTHNKES